MLKQCMNILGLEQDFTKEQLEACYHKRLEKIGKYKLFDEAYLFLKDYLIKQEKEKKSFEAIKRYSNYIINNYDNDEAILRQRIKNIYEYINACDQKAYLEELKMLLRNAPFDYYKSPQVTLELWNLYSKYVDASYYKKISKK